MKHATNCKNISRRAARIVVKPNSKDTGLKSISLLLAFDVWPSVLAAGDLLSTENIGEVSIEIRRAGEGVYPLVTFSHGVGSCPSSTDGIQSRLADAGHSAWTDGRLSSRFHNQMRYYLVSFFDAYLKNGSKAKLENRKSRVNTLDFEH